MTLQFSAFLVVLGASLASLVLAVSVFLENRALGKLPTNLDMDVFDRTFNVFDPFPTQQKTISSVVSSIPFLALIGGLTIAYFGMIALATEGLALAVVVLIFCLGILMLDEAYELLKNARIFVNASKSGGKFAAGDIAVLLIMKKTLPKLCAYYLFLVAAFVTSAAVFPYVVPVAMQVLARFVGVALDVAAYAGILGYILAALVFAATEVAVYFVLRKVKGRVFGFYPSGALVSAASASIRMRISKETLNHVLESKPEEETW